MPYKDKEKQKQYQREWLLKRRQAWIEEHGPCVVCGSWDDLEIDHIDRTTKSILLAAGTRIFSWSKERREAELAKCQILCKGDHRIKTNADFGWGKHGISARYKAGCRCDDCRIAHTIAKRGQRSRRRTRTGKDR